MATNYIYNETPSWVVDWVNKTFTVLNDIEVIDEIQIGWADYDWFIFSWKVITLNDAPTIALWAPSVSYFKYDPTNVPLVDPQFTLNDLLDDIYLNEIWQSRLSEQFPERLAIRHVQDIIRKANNMKVNSRLKVWEYSFNKAADKRVISYSATEVATDPFVNNYTPSSTWMIMIGHSWICNYSWIDLVNNKFTWITNLDFVYSTDDHISIWYKIPSKVKKVSEVLLNWKPLTFYDRREFQITRSPFIYTIVDWYIFLPFRYDLDDVVTVQYIKHNVIPFEYTDLIDFENDYISVLRDYVCYRVFQSREDDRFIWYKQEYLDWLRLYKNFVSKFVNAIKTKIPSSIRLGLR